DPRVLNALRHHLRDRVCGSLPRQATAMCSTPYGITAGIGCSATALKPDRYPVLNALRHHRRDRAAASLSDNLGRRVLDALRHHRRDRWVEKDALAGICGDEAADDTFP